MHHAKLLDCTLRDGAYLIDKKFGDETICGIVDGLMKAKVDFIEIGFFQNDGFGEGKTVFLNSADAKRLIPNDKCGCQFTVLADYSRYDVANLDECAGDSIDAVRECFFKKERFDALEACRVIKQKGYKLFVQPVDILGYTDIELIEFINLVNEIEPYCISIVDTFGSMYQEDLHRVFEIINHNLVSTCRVGFHSHNNMQMSSALSQEFIRMTYGKREVVVDGTVSGMGRGAGNTPTELIAQYMVAKLGYNYDIDALLDIIDDYMENIKTKCSWGYSTPFFIAGCYSAHVNNIAYLESKNSIRSKDIRFILNKIGAQARKRYDYGLLEKTYLDHLLSDIDDSSSVDALKSKLENRDVLIIAPGRTAITYADVISNHSSRYNSVVIAINFVPEQIQADFIYVSNTHRYEYLKNKKEFVSHNRIITSNIKQNREDKELIISFNRLVKCGWDHIDNSTIMVLRLLDMLGVYSISIAGFDGYSYDGIDALNYASQELEISKVKEDPKNLNEEISSMLIDYLDTRNSKCKIHFITPSRFEKCKIA